MAEKRLTCLPTCGFYAFLCYLVLVIAIFCANCRGETNENQNSEAEQSLPTVFFAILVRNKAHTLPWFFGHLELINYPKNRIALWYVLNQISFQNYNPFLRLKHANIPR